MLPQAGKRRAFMAEACGLPLDDCLVAAGTPTRTAQGTPVIAACGGRVQTGGSDLRKKHRWINAEIPGEFTDIVLADLASPSQDVGNR